MRARLLSAVRAALLIAILLLPVAGLPGAAAVQQCVGNLSLCAGTFSLSEGTGCAAQGTGWSTTGAYVTYLFPASGGVILLYGCESEAGARTSSVLLLAVAYHPATGRQLVWVQWGSGQTTTPCALHAEATGAAPFQHESRCVILGPPILVLPALP